MLSQIRGALKGVVLWFFVVLLVLAFAAFGVPELRQFTRRDAVRVGNVGVSAIEIQNEFNRAVTNRRIESDGAFTREDAIAAGLPDQIVNSIALRSAIEQEAERMGLAMPRDLVAEFLRADDNFKNPQTGKFDQGVLQAILQQYGMSVAEFERLMRGDLKRNQLVAAVSSGGPAPTSLVQRLMMREMERRDVSYVTVTEDMAGAPAEPTPEDLRTYHADNAAAFTAPEYRTFTYVALKEADFAARVDMDEAKLRELYDASPARWAQPERRTLYQLTYDSESAAAAAVADLAAGKPFETLAVARGLSLETVTLADVTKEALLDPSVAEAAFDPERGEGDVIGPVKGLFGYAVMQIAGVTPAETRSFESVREELRAQSVASDARKRLFDTIETLENERDTGAALAASAENAGLEVVRFGPVDSFSFGTGGEIVDGVPGDVLREAFRLEEGEESDAVEYDDKTGYFFVAVDAVTPPALTPFETVEDEVYERWRKDERTRRIADVVRQIREAVDGGASLAEAASPFNRAPITETLSRRYDGDDFSPSLVDQAFSADKGELFSGPAAIGEAQIVARVNEIRFDYSGAAPSQVAALGEYVGYQLDQEILDAYASTIRSDLGVKIDQAQIDAIFADAP